MPAFGSHAIWASRALVASRIRSLVYGSRAGFVEIVDAPDQAAFDVAPGSEVLHVQVAHRQHDGRLARAARRCPPRFAPTGR